MKAQQTQLMVMAGKDKSGQRVWAVQSASQTAVNGYPVFHILTWDDSAVAWVCGCPSYKPCVHMRLASEASKAEKLNADPIIARRDTGPRLFREPLVERVREAM